MRDPAGTEELESLSPSSSDRGSHREAADSCPQRGSYCFGVWSALQPAGLSVPGGLWSRCSCSRACGSVCFPLWGLLVAASVVTGFGSALLCLSLRGCAQSCLGVRHVPELGAMWAYPVRAFVPGCNDRKSFQFFALWLCLVCDLGLISFPVILLGWRPNLMIFKVPSNLCHSVMAWAPALHNPRQRYGLGTEWLERLCGGKGPGGVGQCLAEHEPAVCPGGQEGQ